MNLKCVSVAIDGPAGAGKSTVARGVAEELGAMYLDTGAMYRAIGLGVMRRGADPADADEVRRILPQLELTLAFQDGQRVLLDGEDVTGLIRTPACSQAASLVSAVPEVRKKMVAIQRETARGISVVMDGRDIGTHVLPGATLKIFLTASPEERARRRYEELRAKGGTDSLETVLRDMERRDRQDMTRAASPLEKAADAVELDTTGVLPEEVTRRIIALVRARTEA